MRRVVFVDRLLTPTDGTSELPRGTMAASIFVEILIPLTSNEGSTFTHDHHAAFEAHLLIVAGGFSLLPGTVAGGWSDDGVVYNDTLRVYAVTLVSITEGGKVREIVDFAKAHYTQLAIFVRYLGLAEVL